jgi:Ca2+-binding EF-hand superfamily protein
MIDEVDVNGDKNLVRSDDADEKFRAMFKKYDTDLTNYLEIEELYTVLVKEMGVQITMDEVMMLMAEFD